MDEEAAPEWTAKDLEPAPLREEVLHEQHLIPGKQALSRALAHLAHHLGHCLPEGLADELGSWPSKDALGFRVQVEEGSLSIEQHEAVAQALDHSPEIFGSDVSNHDPNMGSRAGGEQHILDSPAAGSARGAIEIARNRVWRSA